MKYACREVSRLASDAIERKLSPWENVRLRLHLLLCGNCRNFRNALKTMHEIMARLREARYGDVKLSNEQRRAILAAIEGKLGD